MDRPRTSVGIEIEINQLPHNLDIDRSLWVNAHEHCGVELRTTPCAGVEGLRKLKRSIRKMEKSPGSRTCGFNNAGTHIHIDFLNDVAPMANLKRKAAKYNSRHNTYENPTGTGKKWFWIDERGVFYRSPSHYSQKLGLARRPADVYKNTGKNKHTLLAVKRFMAIGIRFADVLFAIQHSDRRFNKYCHTIEDWNEDLLFEQKSIQAIATHPNLQQNHRRHMFNVLSFAKWGTIEIRMLKASLNTDEIWAQLMLFTRLARLARSKAPIPKPTGLITKDFTVLLNFAGMHGKYRKILVDMFGRSLKTRDFNCFCYSCYSQCRQSECYDYGLSRAVCRSCHNRASCISCGRSVDKSRAPNSQRVDELIVGGRWICRHCKKSGDGQYRLNHEKSNNIRYALGTNVGSGFDSKGFRQLRRMRELFT